MNIIDQIIFNYTNNKSLYINHKPGNTIDLTEDIDDLEYDLYISLDLYRLKHLINNDYAMGFLSLWNGGFKCKRKSLEYNPIEKKFWRWVRTVTLHLGGKPHDNEHS